jgi:hypothetical protein
MRISTELSGGSSNRSSSRGSRGSRGSSCSSPPRRGAGPSSASPPYRPVRRRGGLWDCNCGPYTDGDVGFSAALLAFDTHNHVVLFSKLQACGFPRAEVVARVDGAAAVHLGADGPVLLEVGVVTDDGGGVGAFFLPDLVGAAVRGEGAVLRGAGVVGGVVPTH